MKKYIASWIFYLEPDYYYFTLVRHKKMFHPPIFYLTVKTNGETENILYSRNGLPITASSMSYYIKCFFKHKIEDTYMHCTTPPIFKCIYSSWHEGDFYRE